MIRKSLGSLALAGVLLGAIVPATFAKSVVVPPSRSTDSIVEIASDAGFTTLLAAVGCADPAVAAALTSGDQYTVFAPTDQAFSDLGLNPGNICGAFSRSTLTSILLYHVEAGRHFSNSVLPKRAGQVKTVETLLGQTFKVSSSGAIRTASGATNPQIVAANIPATNGVIHVVNAVLVPNL